MLAVYILAMVLGATSWPLKNKDALMDRISSLIAPELARESVALSLAFDAGNTTAAHQLMRTAAVRVVNMALPEIRQLAKNYSDKDLKGLASKMVTRILLNPHIRKLHREDGLASRALIPFAMDAVMMVGNVLSYVLTGRPIDQYYTYI